MRLNPEQRAAVEHGPSDLFVSAGAGSGKTRVLTARFVDAVLGIEPYSTMAPREILTVTFTDRAAGEIAERIRRALLTEGAAELSRRVEEAWISTIHGMCGRILRQHSLDAGIDPGFRVADEVEAGVLAHEAMEAAIRAGIAAGDRELESLLDAMSLGDIVSAVRAVHATARSMGVSPTSVSPMDARGVQTRIGDARERLAGVKRHLGTECRTSLKTVVANIGILESVVAEAEALASGARTPSADELREPARLGRLAGDDAHNALVAEANEAIEELELLRAQLAARPLEEALLRLTVSFDSRYSAAKRERSLLDFEDLQLEVAMLLETRPDIASEYRRRFRMVMIDEFQDTNELQLRIAERLSDGDLFTVGDDKQSIYAFRHADVEVFRARERSAISRSSLADNYRSHPELLDFFNGLFGHAALFGEGFMPLRAGERAHESDGWPLGRERAQVMFAEPDDGGVLSGVEAEAEAVADEFASLRKSGVDQGEMVVLLRKMTGVAEVFERALERRGFDVFIASGGTFFDTRETGEMIALLRLIDNALDDEAAVTVLAGRLTRASDDALFDLSEAARERGGFWRAAISADELGLASADLAVISRTTSVIESVRDRRGSTSLGELLLEVCEELDYDLTLLASGDRGSRAWANVLKLVRIAEEYEAAESGDAGAFVEYLRSREAHVASEQQAVVAGERAAAVRVMSVHAAKGLEFPVVAVASFSGKTLGVRNVLVGRGDDNALVIGARVPLPEGSKRRTAETLSHRRLADQAARVAEDELKRLLYVACTRAERGLVLCLRDDFAKPPNGGSPQALVRRALGDEGAGLTEGSMVLGNGSSVGVRLVKPEPANEVAPEMPQWESCEEPPLLPTMPVASPQRTYRPATFSYSALDLYKTCPYKFYAEKVARLPRPVASRRGLGADAREFGTAVHLALREAFSATFPDQERLATIGAAHGLSADELPRLKSAFTAFTSSVLAAQVRSADRVVTECPVNVDFGGSVLVGSIDLLAWIADKATIVDYKTGTSELSAEAARERFALQAECYALAALRAGASEARVVFVELERDGRKTEFDFTNADATAIESAIRTLLDAISVGEFDALEAYDARACSECPAQGTICRITGAAG